MLPCGTGGRVNDLSTARTGTVFLRPMSSRIKLPSTAACNSPKVSCCHELNISAACSVVRFIEIQAQGPGTSLITKGILLKWCNDHPVVDSMSTPTTVQFGRCLHRYYTTNAAAFPTNSLSLFTFWLSLSFSLSHSLKRTSCSCRHGASGNRTVPRCCRQQKQRHPDPRSSSVRS